MPMETRQLRSAPIAATGKFKIPPAIRTFPLQSGEMKRDPEMDKLAVWAGSGYMAVSPTSGLRFVSPLCIIPKCLSKLIK